MLGSKDDFVLHFKEPRDYRYLIRDAELRSSMIETIKQLFADKFHQNLPIFAVEKKKGLKQFTTCPKRARMGLSLMPPIQFRLFSENLIKEDSMDKKSLTSKGSRDTMSEKKTANSDDPNKSVSSEEDGGL